MLKTQIQVGWSFQNKESGGFLFHVSLLKTTLYKFFTFKIFFTVSLKPIKTQMMH